MSNFVFDIETCAIDSKAIVLSAAIVHFDLDEDLTYEDLVQRSLYVKFKAREQKTLGRIYDKETLNWWMTQPEAIRTLCFTPSARDLDPKEGIKQIRSYVAEHGGSKSFMWARGSLDQMVFESFCKDYQEPTIIHYNSWMDVRTAIRITKETADKYAYCTIPGFMKDIVDKHNPIADVCYDALQLIKGV